MCVSKVLFNSINEGVNGESSFSIACGSGVLVAPLIWAIFKATGEWDVAKACICVKLYSPDCRVPCPLINPWERCSWGFSRAKSKASVQSVSSILELSPIHSVQIQSINRLCGPTWPWATLAQGSAVPATGEPETQCTRAKRKLSLSRSLNNLSYHSCSGHAYSGQSVPRCDWQTSRHLPRSTRPYWAGVKTAFVQSLPYWSLEPD